MKKSFLRSVAFAVIAVHLSSCATVFGGRVGECQRTKPAKDQPAREVRGAALIADVLLFPPGVLIDYATGAIYKPCGNQPGTGK